MGTAARAIASPAVESAVQRAESYRRLKLDLMDVQIRLLRVNPQGLSDDDHAAWSEQLMTVNMAINLTRNKELAELNAAFQAEVTAIHAVTDRLTDDLFELQTDLQRIRAIGQVIGVIDRIIQLVA